MQTPSAALRLGIGIVSSLPLALSAQSASPPQTGSLVFVVGLQWAADGRGPSPKDSVIPGAALTMSSGVVVGTTNDSGYVTARDIPAGRVRLTFRAKDYAPLRCQVEVRPGAVDTVRVTMHREKVPAIWSSAGCR